MRKILFIALAVILASSGLYSQERYWYRNAGPFDGHVYSIAIDRDNQIYVGGESNVYRSSDAGSSWNNFSDGMGSTPIYTFAIDNDNNIWAGGVGNLYRYDGGANWISMNSTLNDYKISAITFDDRGAIYIGTVGNFQGGDGGIYRSIDGGITWEQFNSGLSNLQITKLAIVDTVMYAGTLAGLFRSVDSAKSWQPFYAPGTGQVTGFAVHPTTGKLYASFYGAGLYRFDGEPDGWTKVGSSAFQNNVNGFYMDPDGNIYAAIENSGLMRTSDLGVNWGDFSGGFEAGTNVTAFARNSAGDFFVGTSNGLYSSIGNVSANDYSTIKNVFVSPNPFSSQAVLTYNFERPTTVNIRLYNSFGERVSSFEENLTTAPGTREFYIDATGLPSGVYILNIIENGALSRTEKLIIRK
ncbi:MAG: T9SS type A sorting domain-containing protein [Chloroflexota bacterium]